MKRRSAGIVGSLTVGIFGAGLAGCGAVETAPALPSDAFVANPPVVGPDSGEPLDRPGQVAYDGAHRPAPPPAADAPHVSRSVRESVRWPEETALASTNPSVIPPPDTSAPGPATAPANAAPGASTGAWQWVGTVLAVVNQDPIFADKVIKTLDRALAAEARSGSEEHFRAVADDLVTKQIGELIENDLEYEAAKKSLEKGDEQVAKFVTSEWRKDQVRKAGGSEALARQRAADEGQDFEELVQQQYRLNMTRLYYQKKVVPLIQISAQDERDFYTANLRRYQKPAAAKFRVIFVGSDATGSREAALEKARRQVYEPARAGADFAELAAKINDDPVLMRSKGAVGDDKGWMERGAFAADKVEAAVWRLQPGEITDPIDAREGGRDGFFVARLEAIQPGTSEPFDSQKVQDDIHATLWREQFARLRDEHRRALLRDAVITENPQMHQIAMEMVMQRYRAWVAAAK